MLKLLFYFCVALLSLGQFASLSKSTGASIYMFDIAVGAFAVCGVFSLLVSKQLHLPKNLILYIVFAFIAGLSLVPQIPMLSADRLAVSAFYLLRWVFYVSAGVVLFNMLRTKVITKDEIFKAFLISALFISLAGFAQLVLLPDFETLDPSLGWDPHKNRLASTFFDPNFTGGYLVINFLFLLHHFSKKKKEVLYLAFTATLLAAIFLTFSRSAWGMLAVGVLVYGIFRWRLLLILGVSLVFLAYFAVPRVQTRFSGITDPADSAHFRLISWKNTLEIAEDNLLMGVGFNTFRYAQVEYGFFDAGTIGGNSGAGSDSSFLLVLATTGLVGIAVFVAAYFYPLAVSFLTKSKYRLLLLAVFSGILLQAQFINAIFYPQILFLWVSLLSTVADDQHV